MIKRSDKNWKNRQVHGRKTVRTAIKENQARNKSIILAKIHTAVNILLCIYRRRVIDKYTAVIRSLHYRYPNFVWTTFRLTDNHTPHRCIGIVYARLFFPLDFLET